MPKVSYAMSFYDSEMKVKKTERKIEKLDDFIFKIIHEMLVPEAYEGMMNDCSEYYAGYVFKVKQYSFNEH